MPFEILNKQIEAEVDKITTQVKRYKNGVVVDSLKKAGILYEMSYGVSIVHLKNIVSNYKPDNQLAKTLWRKQWRETMMLSTLLLEKDIKSLGLLQEFCNEAQTEEVLQQIGMNALGGMPNSLEVIKNYITSGNTNSKIVACYALHQKVIGKNISDNTADEFTLLLLDSSLDKNSNWMEINALAKVLSKVGYMSGIENSRILEYFSERISLSKSWMLAYEMVKTEFEYR